MDAVGEVRGFENAPSNAECDELDIVEDEKKIYEGFEIACEDSSKSREVPFGMLRPGLLKARTLETIGRLRESRKGRVLCRTSPVLGKITSR